MTQDSQSVVSYASRCDAVMRGLAAFCEGTPDFDMSPGMRRSAAEHILGMVNLAAPSTSVREDDLRAWAEASDYLASLYERLWKGGAVRDLAEAIGERDRAAALVPNPDEGKRHG